MSPSPSPCAPLRESEAPENAQDIVMDNEDSNFETTFSRMEQDAPKDPAPRRRRHVYGLGPSSLELASTSSEKPEILTASDFLNDEIPPSRSPSLFASFDDDGAQVEGQLDPELSEYELLSDIDDQGLNKADVIHRDDAAIEASPAETGTEWLKEKEETELEDDPLSRAKPDDESPVGRTKRGFSGAADVPSEQTDPGRELLQVKAPFPEKTEQPDKEALIPSIDNLFVHADKDSVTVRDVLKALEAEYDINFTKPTKLMVRSHLKDLITGSVEPAVSVPTEESSVAATDDEKDDLGHESESSEYKEEQHAPTRRFKSRQPSQKTRKGFTRTSSHVSQKEKKSSHVRIHAEMLRKRRIEELKVRNEEMQVQRSKEDQKRAELIAAKFDTDTDELRLKRLEDRLDLLHKLDQKRSQVISFGPHVETVSGKAAPVDADPPASVATEESDSDDDLELEVVPSLTKTRASMALTVLNHADWTAPMANFGFKKKEVSWTATSEKPMASPGKSLSARAALRSALLKKQRRVGNLWLARELGYKTEKDHLNDCVTTEERKRAFVLKKEGERMRANERHQLRERLLLMDDNEMDADGEFKEATSDGAEEIDEELEMARAIEREQRANQSGDTAFIETEILEESNSADKPRTANASIDEPSVNDHELSTTDHVVDDSELVYVGSAAYDDETTVGFDQHVLSDGTGENLDHDALTSDQGRIVAESRELKEITGGLPMASPSSANTNAKTGSVPSTSDSAKMTAHDEAEEKEFQSDTEPETTADVGHKDTSSRREKNAGWKAMLEQEANKIKKLKGRKGGGLVEAEADEEEEEEGVMGLEDFGFSLNKKEKDGDDEADIDAEGLTEEDLKHVVDDVSDDEGDEEEGDKARQELAQKEERERHKEIIRRMRDGFDGRRGGIAGAGVGARGMHRFDQLVAADNRDDAKRLGLLNDDELDSDDEGGLTEDATDSNEVEDETALLDKMLKDRFLHRSSNDDELEENFSSDEEDAGEKGGEDESKDQDEADDKEQELLAKRFSKRARMQRLIETYGDDQEFSQARLIDEDETMKSELSKMNDGLVRKQRDLSRGSSSRPSSSSGNNSQEALPANGAHSVPSLATGGSSLSIALQASRRSKTSFLGGSSCGKEICSVSKNISLSHVVFSANDSQLSRSNLGVSHASRNGRVSPGKRKRKLQTSTSLWSKVSANGFKKRR